MLLNYATKLNLKQYCASFRAVRRSTYFWAAHKLKNRNMVRDLLVRIRTTRRTFLNKFEQQFVAHFSNIRGRSVNLSVLQSIVFVVRFFSITESFVSSIMRKLNTRLILKPRMNVIILLCFEPENVLHMLLMKVEWYTRSSHNKKIILLIQLRNVSKYLS